MFKIYNLVNNNVNDIIVFQNSSLTDIEKKIIQQNKINVIQSSYNLYEDFSIGLLKLLILDAFNNTISDDELYLFGKTQVTYTNEFIWNYLTKNNKQELNNNTLKLFISNINEDINYDKENDHLVSYNDFQQLNLNKKVHIDIAIGQSSLNNKTYIVNPYNIEHVEQSNIQITTNNSKLLLDYDIQNNIIYMVSAKNILDSNISTSIYYPFLHKENIQTLNELNARIKSSSNKKLNKESILLISDLWHLGKDFNDTHSKGIKNIFGIFHNKNKVSIPLEDIFKQINSNNQVPFIKLNLGNRQEKIIRLYTIGLNEFGKKIPSLLKSKIIQLNKEIATQKCIGFYLTQNNSLSEQVQIIIEMNQYGDFFIHLQSKQLIAKQYIEKIIKINLNPLITIINQYLQSGGYHLDYLNDLNQLQDINIDYFQDIELKQRINIDKYVHCISQFFLIMKSDIKSGIKMRYKRVSNFNEMTSQQAFIIEQINSNNLKPNIILKLQQNYNITEDQAKEIYATFLDEIQLEQTLHENRKLRVKDNPGFLTEISKTSFQNILSVKVSNITSFKYIQFIHRYINTFCKLIQDLNISDSLKTKCIQQKDTTDKTVELDEINLEKDEVKELILNNEDDNDDYLSFFMDDSEDETDEDNTNKEEDSLEEADENKLGGSHKPLHADITGLNLTNPNYFSKRMENRDPKLFVKSIDNKAFKSYSRICASNMRRQPVILTEEEKDFIDKHHPDSYDKAIKYGSSEDNQHYYICPRYWCIPENTSISRDEIDKGACGGPDAIIPHDAKIVPPGKTIYEFFSNREHLNNKGEYIKHNPGFIAAKDHPDGLCQPCCFKNWNAAQQVKRRKECLNKSIKQDSNQPKQSDVLEDYIKTEDKFPLEQNRWGVLPLPLRLFFFGLSSECTLNTSGQIAEKKICLLRQGVELNQQQSFIACIADLFVEYITSNDIPSIKKMRDIIKDSISMDIFIRINNGNLVNQFANKAIDTIDIETWKTDPAFKHLDLNKENDSLFMKKVILSYNNFMKYLSQDDQYINYQYLWDVISQPNSRLFPRGINLIIFEVNQDDITNNIEIICPTKFMNKFWFNGNKRILMLLKRGNYFEPIYGYKDLGDNTVIRTKVFSLKDTSLPISISESINRIISYQEQCKPLSSLPDKYTFKQNITVAELEKECIKSNIKVIKYLMNYDSKIIAIEAEFDSRKGLIPCYPSSIPKTNKPIEFIYDYKWGDYESTKTFLENINNKNSFILCKPQLKVEEDELIIGILTETNQFIGINPPKVVNDELPTTKGNNYIKNDSELMLNNKKDEKRIRYIKHMKLEKNFFSVFRNMFKLTINDFNHLDHKKNIIELIQHKDMPYSNKILLIKDVIYLLLQEKVLFYEYNDELLDEINHISICNENCDDTFCTKIENKCVFLIPKKNLMNGFDNELYYYFKLADQLLRYTRITQYLFDSSKFLSIGNHYYQVNEDELLLFSNDINQEFFKHLNYKDINSYKTFNTYDMTNPIKSKFYNNKILKDDLSDCNKKKQLIYGKWKDKFSSSFREVVYDQNKECGWLLLTTISGKTIQELKTILVKKYATYEDQKKLLGIFKVEGKSLFVSNILSKNYDLQTLIYNEIYYITNIDIWIIANELNLPIVFITSTKLKENNKNLLSLTKPADSYIFIKCSAIQKDLPNKYSIIINNDYNIASNLLSQYINDAIENNWISLDDYINDFKIKFKKLVVKKKDS